MIVYGWDTRRKRRLKAFDRSVDFLEQPLDVQALKFRLRPRAGVPT